MRRRFERGVTLIELMVVVIIIAILAGLSVPGLLAASDDRRAYRYANDVNLLFRQARARAWATGTAQMLRLSTDNRGTFELFEAVAVGAQPATDCRATGQWSALPAVGAAELNMVYPNAAPAAPDGTTRVRFIDQVRLGDSTEAIAEALLTEGGASIASFHYCITPGGTVYGAQTLSASSAGTLSAVAPMNSVVGIEVSRLRGGTREGIKRTITLIGGLPPTLTSR